MKQQQRNLVRQSDFKAWANDLTFFESNKSYLFIATIRFSRLTSHDCTRSCPSTHFADRRSEPVNSSASACEREHNSPVIYWRRRVSRHAKHFDRYKINVISIVTSRYPPKLLPMLIESYYQYWQMQFFIYLQLLFFINSFFFSS